MRRRVALALWVMLILTAVVPWRRLQDHPHWARVQWIPYVSQPQRLRDNIANVLMYVPFGYLYVRQRQGTAAAWRAVPYAAALSIATEATQLFSHGRFPSLTDVVNNVAGAGFGAGVALAGAHAVARLKSSW